MQYLSTASTWRRRVAIVVASVLAVALVPLAGPAGAQPAPAPDISAACADAESAGFTDTAGTGFETEIDCLAGFGVTTGTTATTYSPAVQVRRSQMALFYYRVGTAAGLTWDTSDAGFGDLAGLDADFVDAINALANAGIVQGTSASEFSPQDRIRRSQMALFIDRFQAELTGFAYSDGFTGDDLFPDISTLGAEARLAVNGIGSVGISQGDASGNYVPSGFVSRQQMAAFIVRHLAENGLEVPGAVVEGMLVDRSFPNSYVVATGSSWVEVDIAAGDTFSIEDLSATQTAFESAAGASTSGLGHHMTHDPATGSHDIVPRDDEALLGLGLTVGFNLDAGAAPIMADLIEPATGETIVAASDVPWDDIAHHRIANTTVDEAAILDDVSLGDRARFNLDSNDEWVLRLTNDSVSGLVGVEDDGTPNAALVSATGTGAIFPIYNEVEPSGWSAGNDTVGSDQFVPTQSAYDAGTQRYHLDGAPVNYGVIDTFLAGLDDDALDVDAGGGVRLVYQRSGDVETFVFTTDVGDDPAGPQQGTITGAYVAGSATASTLEMLVGSDLFEVEFVDDGTVLVDGVITAGPEVPAAIEAGASVTAIVGDDTQIDLDNDEVEVSEPGDQLIITNP